MTNDNSVIAMPQSQLTAEVYLPHQSKALAIAESLLLIGGVALIDYVGLAPYEAWPVHPLMLVVILLSAQYGIQGGVLASLGAIALTHLDGLPTRPFDLSYAEYFQLVWRDALSWLIAALTVGIVTSYRNRVLREQSEKLRRSLRAESLITAQYDVLAKRTHMLERSLAARSDDVALTTEKATATKPGQLVVPAWVKKTNEKEPAVRTKAIRKVGRSKARS